VKSVFQFVSFAESGKKIRKREGGVKKEIYHA